MSEDYGGVTIALRIATDDGANEKDGLGPMSVKPYGDPVSECLDDFDRIHFLQVFYIGFNKGRLATTQIQYPRDPADEDADQLPAIPYGDVGKIVTSMLPDLRQWKEPTNATRVGWNFSNNKMVWRHRAHWVFVFDSPQWTFLKENDDPSNKLPSPIVFRDGPGRNPNKAFYNGKHIGPLELDGKKAAAYQLVNYHTSQKPPAVPQNMPRDVREHLLCEGQILEYKFDIYLRLWFNATDAITVIFDPGGSNEGPTMPPPRPG
jgi:hypothetical protein